MQLHSKQSKDIFVFAIFVFISSIFWLLTTLNETYETELKVRLDITDVPSSIIITESLPDTIKVTIKDKGFNLIKMMYLEETPVIHLPFNLYANKSGHGVVTTSELQKILKPRFVESCTILSIKADHLDFYYNHGTKKKVPVLLNGNITPKRDYYISSALLLPDSVSVMAATSTLDTIKAVYTEPINIDSQSESTAIMVKVQHIVGAKISPENVKLNIVTDRLTELTLEVPVKAINCPPNVLLKTFPSRVAVKVAVGVKNVSHIKAEQFTVVADYNTIIDQEKNEKIPIRLVTRPKGIVTSHLNVTSVDYLIEEQP